MYEDGEMEREFLAKRKSMWVALKNQGIETELSSYLNSEYEDELTREKNLIIELETKQLKHFLI